MAGKCTGSMLNRDNSEKLLEKQTKKHMGGGSKVGNNLISRDLGTGGLNWIKS